MNSISNFQKFFKKILILLQPRGHEQGLLEPAILAGIMLHCDGFTNISENSKDTLGEAGDRADRVRDQIFSECDRRFRGGYNGVGERLALFDLAQRRDRSDLIDQLAQSAVPGDLEGAEIRIHGVMMHVTVRDNFFAGTEMCPRDHLFRQYL